MSFFEDLFEMFEGKRRRGHNGGYGNGHHGGYGNGHHGDHHNDPHDRHSYDNYHDQYAHEENQINPNVYKNKEQLLCPKCSSEVQPGAKFCHSCGASMVTDRNCPGCGSRIQLNSTFCTNCGRKVNNTGIERIK